MGVSGCLFGVCEMSLGFQRCYRDVTQVLHGLIWMLHEGLLGTFPVISDHYPSIYLVLS